MKFSNRHASGYLHSFHPADSVTLLQSGPSFFNRLLELIESTQRVLHIQMYILDFEGVGARVEEALHRAAARGVDIYLLADGFGSRMLQQASIDRLLEAGIQFRWFSRISLFRNTTIGRRLHHKVVVADGQMALVGGINIAQKYHGSPDQKAWLDFAIELSGPVCLNIEKLCAQIEEREYRPRLKDLYAKAAKGFGVPVSIRRNDWLRNKKQIFYSYVAAINRADRSIILFASYFLPGNRIRKALEQASKRGVDITIVLAGKSDIPLAINATYYLYRWLHRCQIKIYEWNPSVLHAKLAIIDDQWMTIGSFNLNHLSAYGSIELNIDIMDPSFAKDCRNWLEQLIETGCTLVSPDRERPLLTRIREFVAYILGRGLVMLVTFFPNFRNFYSRNVD